MTGETIQIVLLANVASTLMLVGLIWFVQIVHYPQLARVGREQFTGYEAAHIRLTTRVVAGPMLVEAATSALLVWQPPSPDLALACGAGLALVLVIWMSTITLQVPKHDVLAKAFDVDTIRALVRSNWIRTIGWSLRGALVLYLLSGKSGGGATQSP